MRLDSPSAAGTRTSWERFCPDQLTTPGASNAPNRR